MLNQPNASIKNIKVNGDTCRRSNSTRFASLLSRGQLLKRRICSSKSKFFPLRSDFFQKPLHHSEKQTEVHINYSILFAEERQGKEVGINF